MGGGREAWQRVPTRRAKLRLNSQAGEARKSRPLLTMEEDNSTKISWLKRDGEAHLLHCPALSKTNTQVGKVSGIAILYAISTEAPDVNGAVRINS